MAALVIALLIGIACIIIGIMNTRGNISMLHSYHTKRVSEEDRLPFGKRVGIGTIIIGASVVVNSVLSALTLQTGNAIFTTVGMAILFAGLAVGIVIVFHAMIKYNKGIF